MAFVPFDPDGETLRSRQNLPHWRQVGVTYFVTSRLCDSLPEAVLDQWKSDRQQWLRCHGLERLDQVPDLPQEKRHEFHRKFTKKWHDWLDAGHGACFLKRPEIAELVVQQFLHGFPDQYALDAWVLMPNHFHVLVAPGKGVTLSRVLQQWKGGSARKANLALDRRGSFWMDEPFDHIVRSEAQLNHFRRYIAENPLKAGLGPGEYVVGMGAERMAPEALLERLKESGRDFSP